MFGASSRKDRRYSKKDYRFLPWATRKRPRRSQPRRLLSTSAGTEQTPPSPQPSPASGRGGTSGWWLVALELWLLPSGSWAVALRCSLLCLKASRAPEAIAGERPVAEHMDVRVRAGPRALRSAGGSSTAAAVNSFIVPATQAHMVFGYFLPKEKVTRA